MDVDDAIAILWEAIQQGEHFPAALQGQLSLDDAYHVQLGMLARYVAAGERHSGWKIALSSTTLRRVMGCDTPVFGYLLASGHFTSGQTVPYDTIPHAAIESELCLTMGQRLQGPGVTRAQALEAVAALEAAFEIVSLRGDLAADMALGVADDIAQWGYVTGAAIIPYPRDIVLHDITAAVCRNEQTEAQVRSAEVLDDQLESLAWLANALAPYGFALEPGQRVLTGSFTRPTPITKGDQWSTQFSTVGTVTASFG